MACASCSTRFGKCSGSLYWRMTESMSTPSASGGPSTSMISPSGFAWRDSHSRSSTTTLSPDLRRPPGVARRRHVDVLGDARVVRDDVKELPAALQRADQLRPRPLQDAHHPAGGLLRSLPLWDARANIPPHQHMVPVHRRRGGIQRNPDGRHLRIVRLQETHPRPVHADAARHQVSVERQRVAAALFDAGDLPVALQPRQHVFQFPLLAGPQPELPAQFRGIERRVIGRLSRPSIFCSISEWISPS